MPRVRTLKSKVRTIILTTVAVVLIVVPSLSGAPPISVTTNTDFYYKIGGASAITAAPNPAVVTEKIGGSGDIGLGYSCGKFDPTLGIANILNSLDDVADDLINGAVGAVTAAIGSLPMLILQRVNPGLYDLFQNALIRAEGTISLATKSCEQMEQEIARGKNPYQDWITLAKSIDWKKQMGTGRNRSSSVDVKAAQDTVEENNGTNGIPWVGGELAGGEDDQEPIQVTHDVVTAGYNLTLNRNVTEEGAPPGTDNPPLLVDTWKTPDEAAQWAVNVAGETLIRTFDNRPTESIPGHGLLPIIENEKAEVGEFLADLISGSKPPDLFNLEAVSSSDLLITRDVIQSIRELDPTDRQVALQKLASEIAVARVVEKAVLLRRLLLAGRQEPNVAHSPAPRHINDAVTTLDREIDNILFETRVRKELFANTARILVGIEGMRENRSDTQDESDVRDQHLIEESATQ